MGHRGAPTSVPDPKGEKNSSIESCRLAAWRVIQQPLARLRSLYNLLLPRSLSLSFFFSSSYLPSWHHPSSRIRRWQYESFIAHRGDENCPISFGESVGVIFDCTHALRIPFFSLSSSFAGLEEEKIQLFPEPLWHNDDHGLIYCFQGHGWHGFLKYGRL